MAARCAGDNPAGIGKAGKRESSDESAVPIPFASRGHVLRLAEVDGVGQKVAHGPAKRLGMPRLAVLRRSITWHRRAAGTGGSCLGLEFPGAAEALGGFRSVLPSVRDRC